MSMTAGRWLAPAKLNLYLHVVGRRPDGYHLLDSLVAFAAPCDEILVASAPDLSLTVRGPYAAALDGPPQANLVWRAAERLAAASDRRPAAAITLVKNLPVASGIGGGSSDAAATLKALAELWQLDLDARSLAAIGAALGADVPVCLAGRTAWLGGIGECVEPAAPLPAMTVLLANPGIALATARVFAARHGPFSAPARFAEMPRDAAGLVARLVERRNDLAPAAIGLAPVVGDVLARLARSDGALLARMSGSGATCFALFASPDAAHEAMQRLAVEQPRWWLAVGQLA